MNGKFYEIVKNIMVELFTHDKFDLHECDSPSSLTEKKVEKIITENKIKENGFEEYFKLYNGLIINWNAKEIDGLGKIKILKVDKIFSDGKNLVYFDDTPEDSPLRDFHIVDFFVDEACVGMYKDHPELPGMHFFEFESQTYPLHVDFEGYMKLLAETRGFFYWQKVILDHLAKTPGPITQNFKKIMPELFPDFDYDQFIELYESLRIDKK
ncbi:hypothetical protein NBT05_04625 [Aquimarina sp. ERC-38]|uniref:hypothetical protein n=1 Tax=Aquimarina sp. ERC-38 TaxID=2949996 RepID=UPI002246E181|nr:hypothetical protein [Aquimarina sp. ERC-38]UZO81755.1 hypothetical protein NBT05_04625 [Aquimarina sp. ERC-38]